MDPAGAPIAGDSREPDDWDEPGDRAGLDLRLLGPMRLLADGAPVAFRPLRPRYLVAVLALHANLTVSVDRIVAALWREPPVSARQQVYNVVAMARRALALAGDDARIERVGSGYQLAVGARRIDVLRFRHGIELARRAEGRGESAQAIRLLESALGEWSGPALADFDGELFENTATLLSDQRLEALERLSGLLIAAGEPGTAVKRLTPAVAEHPYRELLRALLMRALYLTGRQTDALALFEEGRRVLSEEFGVDPGPDLREAHRLVLRGGRAFSRALGTSHAGAAGAEADPRQPRTRPPCQLPADARILVGREREKAELMALAEPAADGDGRGSVVVLAVDGMGGVGKSTLAVHVAHSLRARYPDGQFYIDLHGHTPGLNPVEPADALRHFLQELGVQAAQMPDDTDMRASALRARLADTRTLILLDNAASTAQIRPLIPGTPGCLVLVTSRRRLTGLGDAHRLSLGTLTEEISLDLLARASGRGPAPHGDESASDLVGLCGYLPLAIRVVAARLKYHETLTVRALLAELREESGRLGRLRDGEQELTGVFDSSVRVLPEDGRRLYRLLSLAPGPDFDAYAAANLLGADLPTARGLLELLLDHNMLIQQVAGRFRFHDLLHAHARGLSAQDGQGSDALSRLLDYYVHTSWAADDFLATRRRRDGSEEPGSAVAAPEFPDQDAAAAWLRTERANLLAAVALDELGPARTLSLIRALSSHLTFEGPWSLAVDLYRRAVTIAREHGDRLAEATATLELGGFLERVGRYEAVIECVSHASCVYRELGDRLGEGHALSLLGQVAFVQSRLADSFDLIERALASYTAEEGSERDTARCLWRLGCIRSFQGDNAQAEGWIRRAMDAYVQIGDLRGESDCLLNYARALYALGDFTAVAPALERALVLSRRCGYRLGTANVLSEMATYQVSIGEYAEAAEKLTEALRINRELGFPLGEGYDHLILGRIGFAIGDLDSALRLYGRALALLHEIGSIYEAAAVQGVARARHALGDLDQAAALLDEALALCEKRTAPLDIQAEVRNAVAALKLDTQGPEAALAAYRDAVAVAVKSGSPLEHARAMEGAGRCEIELGRTRTGLHELEAALHLYRRINAVEYAPLNVYLAEISGGGGIAGSATTR